MGQQADQGTAEQPQGTCTGEAAGDGDRVFAVAKGSGGEGLLFLFFHGNEKFEG